MPVPGAAQGRHEGTEPGQRPQRPPAAAPRAAAAMAEPATAMPPARAAALKGTAPCPRLGRHTQPDSRAWLKREQDSSARGVQFHKGTRKESLVLYRVLAKWHQ